MFKITRRDLLTTPALLAMQGGAAAWYDRPMRWGQLTLVENDPPKLDVGYWLDCFKRCRCDAVTLSAGGVVAYYPTNVPLHYRSADLGGKDSFGDLCRGCKKLNMVVVARVDPHAMHEDAYRAHPEWAAMDERGQVRHHPVMPELYLSCSQGGYNREFLTAVIREHAAVDASGGAAGPRAAGGRSKGRAGKAAGERQKSRMKAAGDVVEVDVPGILDHEVVVVELA